MKQNAKNRKKILLLSHQWDVDAIRCGHGDQWDKALRERGRDFRQIIFQADRRHQRRSGRRNVGDRNFPKIIIFLQNFY